MTFAAFLRRVIEALDACDVPYMATGGVALLVFGVLTICGTTLDEEYMRRLARDLGVESTLEKLLRDLRRPA